MQRPSSGRWWQRQRTRRYVFCVLYVIVRSATAPAVYSPRCTRTSSTICHLESPVFLWFQRANTPHRAPFPFPSCVSLLQPALGELLVDRGCVADHVNGTPTARGSSAAARPGLSPSTGNFKPSPSADVAAARRVHGTHHLSSGRPARVSSVAAGAASDGAAAAGGPGAVKLERAKRDRSVSTNSRGGAAAPPMRIRGRLPPPPAPASAAAVLVLPETPENSAADVSLGSVDGSAHGCDAVCVGPAALRVTSGGGAGRLLSPTGSGGGAGAGSWGGGGRGGGGTGSNKSMAPGSLRVPVGNAAASAGSSVGTNKEVFVHSRPTVVTDAAQQPPQQQHNQHQRSAREGPLRVAARRGSIIPTAAAEGGDGSASGIAAGGGRTSAGRIVGGSRKKMAAKGEAVTQGENNNGSAGVYEEENKAADAMAPAAGGAVAAPRAVVLERGEVLRQVRCGER